MSKRASRRVSSNRFIFPSSQITGAENPSFRGNKIGRVVFDADEGTNTELVGYDERTSIKTGSRAENRRAISGEKTAIILDSGSHQSSHGNFLS